LRPQDSDNELAASDLRDQVFEVPMKEGGAGKATATNVNHQGLIGDRRSETSRLERKAGNSGRPAVRFSLRGFREDTLAPK